MRRFVSVVALLFFAIPFGISINGCGKKTAITYCSGDSGVSVGQVTKIVLGPQIIGISINQGEISQTSSPSGTDCKNASVGSASYNYASSDTTRTLLDIQPTSGRLCGGTWNRNSGGGVPDYTTCTSTGKTGVAYVTATANGVTSNPIPVYVHPVVTSVVLGAPSDAAGCAGDDPATNCSPAATNADSSTTSAVACPVAYANGCCAYSTIVQPNPPVTAYDQKSCVSQTKIAQLAARVYAGTGTNRVNVSCQVGHITYAAQSAGIVTIDQNGLATAEQPGATIVTATVALTGSSAGFFSTCPPADIALSYPGSTTGTTNIIVNQNNTQPISATVTDTNNNPMTGLALEYVSTTPITIPASSNGTVTPTFPGQAAITAICQPPTCNTAPQSELGVFGNGKAVTSKAIGITTPGTNSTVLYVASTDSQYIVPVDFTQTQLGAPVRLPFVPNSIAISNDLTNIYMGSDTELMVVNSSTLAVSRQDTTVHGVVLSVSPDNSTVVISDPVRQQIYLYNSSGAISTTYGGVGTHAAWSPDSQTVYIAAGNQILVHSTFSGWKQLSPATAGGTAVNDVAVTVPAVGAYFSGPVTTARGYCPATVTDTTVAPPAVTNTFYPTADSVAALTDRLAATNDGFHILGANAAAATLNDIQVNLAPVAATTNGPGSLTASGGITCPTNGNGLTFSSLVAPIPLTGIVPTAITGVLPTSDSKVAFVTYTGTSGLLPFYVPPTFGSGGNTSGVAIPGHYYTIPLTTPAIAPVGGTISADNTTLYVGTSGDALVHLISTTGCTDPAAIGTTTCEDTKTIAPNLPSATGAAGTFAVPNLLVQKPRKTT
ncbi:hypothetical protein HDF16_000787 [Granulicella aggregans]|uniref:BIG2 domain-containing protein n=1 Tax=Granulicella aggregans TaxID=474949 RepID=A0A7W8E1R6_9BACT|nr:hypothetical protein [Granulicella aggregans]MBB5056118.1 hypothetical protein [Granulicella aggregans]